MAYTADDLRKMRERGTTRASSSDSKRKYTADDLMAMRGKSAQNETTSLYDSYAKQAVSNTPKYRYNSLEQYDTALKESKPKNDFAKRVANAGINSLNALSGIGLTGTGATPIKNLPYNKEEMAYNDLKKERNLYAQEHMLDEYQKKYKTNADFLAKSNDKGMKETLDLLDFMHGDTMYSRLYENMTDDERAMANYLSNISESDPNAFVDYMMNMRATVNKREFDKKVAEKNAYMNEDGLKKVGRGAALSAESIGENALASIGTAGEYLESYIGGWNPDPYGGASGLGNLAMAEREAVSKDMGEVGSFVYNTGMSVADSALGAALFGEGYSVLMGTNAFNTSYKDLYERGASRDEILLGALTAGAAETVFEKISLENLLKPRGIKDIQAFAKAWLEQAGVEASEEFFTEMTNIITDELTQGANSEVSQMIYQMRNQGIPDDEIQKAVASMLAKRVGEAALGGFLSGGAMGGMFIGNQYAQNQRIGRNTDREELSQALENINPESDVAKEYRGRDLTNLKDTEVGALVMEAYAQADKDARAKYQNAVRDSLENLGLSEGEVGDYYDAIFAEKPTKVQKLLRENETIKDIMRDVNTRILPEIDESARQNKYDIAKTVSNRQGVAKALKKSDLKVGAVTELNGEEVKVTDVIKDGDKITVVTNKGEADPSQLTLSAKDANLVMIASGMENNTMRKAYLNNYHGQNVAEYTDSFSTAYSYGKNGVTEETLLEDIGQTINLSIEDATNIYQQGASEIKKSSNEVVETAEEIKKITKDFRKGNFDDSKIDKKKLSASQRGAYALAQLWTDMGINVSLFNDTSEDSENGYYKDGTVYINLSARYTKQNLKFDRGYVINTMAHELTHWMEDTDSEAFKALKTAIFNYYGEEKTNRLVAQEQQRYEKGTGKSMSKKAAESEVIARACEDMLSDSDTIEKILMGVNADTRNTIVTKIREFIDRLGEFLNKILHGNMSPSEASRMLRESAEDFERVRKIWADTFANAVNKVQQDTETLSNAGIEILDDGIAYNQKTLSESWLAANNETQVKEVAKILANYLGVTQKKAQEYVRNLHTIANIEANNVALQYEDTGLSSWVSNSDYGGNFDFSYLCPKRLVYTGTVAEIRKHFNKMLTPTRFLAIRRFLINAGYEAPCTYCYVESRRVHSDSYIQDFLDKNPQYGLTLAQLTNADELEKLRREWIETGKDNGYVAYEKAMKSLNQRAFKALEKRRAYRGEILNHKEFNETEVERINKNRGLRFFAFSDFEVPHLLDLMQIITDMSARRLAGFAYTKQAKFVEVFGGTGLKINMSCVAKGVDKNGKIIFDDVEGMNSSDAIRLRQKYSKDVGIVCVVFTDEQVKAAMADDRIDYILPFHSSGFSKDMYSMMGLPNNTKDFTVEQSEKWGDETTGNTKNKKEKLKIPVADFWDDNLSGRENAQRYLDIINANGYTPLFRSALVHEGGEEIFTNDGKHKAWKGGKWVLPEGAVGDGYYKLLIEQKMYDNDGNPSPQRPVLPDFDMEAAIQITTEFDENPNTFPVAHDVVDKFLEWEKNGEPLFSNKVDSEGRELTEAQQKFFAKSQVRDEQGRLKVMYHGTKSGGFTVFKRSDDNLSYFFTDNKGVASSYSSVKWVQNPDEPMTYNEVSALYEGYGVGDLWHADKNLIDGIYEYALETYPYADLDNNGGDRESETIYFRTLKEAQNYFVDNYLSYEAAYGTAQPTNYAVYINATNPYVVNAEGRAWYQLPPLEKYERHLTDFVIESGKEGTIVTYTENGEQKKDASKNYDYNIDKLYKTYGIDIDEQTKHFEYDYLKIKDIYLDSEGNRVKPEKTRYIASYAFANGYDSVIFNDLVDNGGYSIEGRAPSQVVVVFDPNQIKSIYNENPTENEDIRYSDKVNVGYHAGDLGKSESLGNQKGGRRDTGAFGTGTYFVGNEEKINYGNFAKRPHEIVDFSKYHLYRPLIAYDANELHEFLKYVNRYAYYEEPAYEGYNFERAFDNFDYDANYKDDKLSVDEAYNRLKKLFRQSVLDYAISELSEKDKQGIAIDTTFTKETLEKYGVLDVTDYLANNSAEDEAEFAEKYRKFKNTFHFMASVLDVSEDTLLNLYSEVRKEVEGVEDTEYNMDSASTLLMKKLGYEGVDVRHIPSYDNTTYGSVIYDLKGEDLERKKEIGTARFSQKVDAEDLLGRNKRLEKENKALEADVQALKDYINANAELSEGKTWNPVDLNSVAKSLADKSKSDIDLKTLRKQLASTYTYITEQLSSGNESWEDIMDECYAVASDIYDEIKNKPTLSKTRITNEIKKAGVTADEETIAQVQDVVSEASKEDFVRNLAVEVYNGYWKASTLKTSADVMQEKVNKVKSDKTKLKQLNEKQQAKIKQLKFEHRKTMDWMLAEQKKADEIHYGKLIERVREDRDTKLKQLKQYVKDRDARVKDAAERRKLISKIYDVSQTLGKRLLNAEKGRKVPDILKTPLANLLNAIDFSSQRLLGIKGGKDMFKPTQNDIAMSTLLDKVRMAVDRFNKGEADDDDKNYDFNNLHLPINFAQELDEIKDKLRTVEDAVGERSVYTLQYMTTEELGRLYEAIKAMRTAINNMNKIISTNNAHEVDYLGNEIMEYLDKLGNNKFENAVTNFMTVANKTPFYFFKHLGKGGQELFSFLQNGWDKLADNVEVIRDFTHGKKGEKPLYTADEFEKWKNTVRTYTIYEPTEDGTKERTFSITEAQMMSLYCLSKREQAMSHISQDGVVIDVIKTKRKYGKHDIKMQDTVHLIESELAKILADVKNDDRMRTVADKLQDFMNTTCAEWGNEVTQKLYGTDEYTEKNYFPIHVNQDVLASEAKDKSKSIYGMLNQSFTKPLVEGARNEIYISDIFDVFASHTGDMAKYNALALPIMDVIKVWNYKEQVDIGDEGNRNVKGVKKSITKAIGKAGNAYIGHLLRDLNGDAESGRYDKATMRLMKNYKTAAVAANIQTALLQPLSYIRAGYMVNGKYLRLALLKKPQVKKCLENIGVQKWKALGFYDTNLNIGLDRIISNGNTWMDNFIEKSLWLTEKMDEITWGYLYTAVELETKDKYPTLSGDKLNEVVAKRLRDVLYGTQVFDSTLSRTDMMRSKSTLVQMETAFGAEPILSVNMLMDAVTSFNQEKKQNGKESAKKKYAKLIGRAGLIYLLSSVVESVLRGILGKLRKYDDDNKDRFEDIQQDILERTLEELDVLNKIPIVKDAMPYIRKFVLSKIGMDKNIYLDNAQMNEEVFNTIYQALNGVYKIFDGGEMNYKTLEKIFKAVSEATGLPISNILKELKTIYNNTIGDATGNMWK